jgi:hypothetical protein
MRHRRSLQLHLRRDAWWRERQSLAKNIFHLSNLIGASRPGKISLSVPSEIPILLDDHANEACNGPKNEGERLQEAHPGGQRGVRLARSRGKLQTPNP